MPTTTENLQEAFAGESQANQKYKAFAKKAEKEGFANIFIISQIIVGFIIIALLILFYWIVYGILLKKLKGNYRELKKINS